MKIKRLMRSCAFEMELDHCDRKCTSNASLQWLIAVAGTSDGERGAELHQLPLLSTVPPSPAKRVCVCHSGGRESRPPAGPHLGNASEHGRLAWLSAVSQSHAPLGIVWERVQNAALPLIGRRHVLRSHTHTQVRTTQMYGYKHPQ